MIIDSLTISNFRNYFGENTLALSPRADKNVILIGGMNGSGKTTLTDAVRLCLYGPKVNGKVLSDSKYQDYLAVNHCRKNRGKKGRYFVSMDLTLNDDYPPLKMTVRREFVKRDGNHYEESLTLTQNGNDVEIIDKNYWDYYIEKLIPPEASRYFFFDGEAVREAIASDSAQAYLQSAINDLTGLSDLTALKTDLTEVRKRITNASSKASSQKKIDEIRRRVSEIHLKNSEFQNSIDELRGLKLAAETEKQGMDAELERALGVKESRSNAIKASIAESKRQLEDQNAAVYEFCFNRLPFMMANSALLSTIERAKREHSNSLTVYSKELLNNAVEGIMSDANRGILTHKGLSKKELNMALDLIRSRIQTANALDEPTILDLTLPRIKKMEALSSDDDESSQFLELFTNRENLRLKIQELESELAKFNDDSISAITEQIATLDAKVAGINDQIRDNERIMAYNKSEIADLESKIKVEERNSIVDIRDKEAINIIDKTLTNIDARADASKAKSLSLLAIGVNDIYSSLKNNKDMVKRIEITSDCLVNLRSYEDDIVSTSGISEGEKGILMYSLIFGLHTLSKSKLPLIIDSPLGRMDSVHVGNLMREFYPHIGQQAIILSHDREITKSGLGQMESVLARTYTIRKDEVPKVVEGYFEG